MLITFFHLYNVLNCLQLLSTTPAQMSSWNQKLYIVLKAKNIYYLEKYDKPNVNQDSDLRNNLYYNSNPQIPFELYYVPGNSNLGETTTSQQLVSQGINGGDSTVR